MGLEWVRRVRGPRRSRAADAWKTWVERHVVADWRAWGGGLAYTAADQAGGRVGPDGALVYELVAREAGMDDAEVRYSSWAQESGEGRNTGPRTSWGCFLAVRAVRDDTRKPL